MDVRSDSDVQTTLANNSAPSAAVTPPRGATGMILSVVTTDVFVAFAGGVPATTKGQVFKAGLQPVVLPFAKAFSFLPTANAATVVNTTWLYN